MTKEPSPHVHPDFTGPADATLVSADGTEFHVQASDLARSSGWFRTLFTVPQGEQKPTAHSETITVSEDSLTLDILLKLACGLPPGLARLETLVEVERVLIAAEKYEMPGVTEVVILLLRLPAMQTDALQLYALAGRYGQADLAAAAVERLILMPLDFTAVAHVDVPQLAHLIALRQRRIERFSALLLQTRGDAPFYTEHDAVCPHNPRPDVVYEDTPHNPHNDVNKTEQTRLAWSGLVSALLSAFIRHPSVGALETDPLVRGLLPPLTKVRCAYYDCRQTQYNWTDILARLSGLMDAPTDASPT